MIKMYKPNHTQTPNEILDKYLPILKGSELKVLLIICRQTIGWHKDTDRISISQLEEKTGLSNRAIIDSSRSLEKRGIIRTEMKGGIKSYELAYEESSQAEKEGVKKVHRGSEKSSQYAYEESSHTKETITKKTKQNTERTRINGVDVLDGFTKDEIQWIEKFIQYLKESHKIWQSSMQTELTMATLKKFKDEGFDPIEIIKTVIQGNHKKLYKPNNYSNKEESNVIDGGLW